jgi:hypothetical protein
MARSMWQSRADLLAERKAAEGRRRKRERDRERD